MMACAEHLISQPSSVWYIEDWNAKITYMWYERRPAEKPRFASRTDVPFRTTAGNLIIFFHKLNQDDARKCNFDESEDGLGRLWMLHDKIVGIEIPLNRVGAHDVDLVDHASLLPPLQIYYRYDVLGDRLFVSLVGSNVDFDDWTSSILPVPDTLGYDLVFGLDASKNVIGFSLLFSSALLLKPISSSSSLQ